MKKKGSSLHTDGSPCLEGVPSAPAGYVACCDTFAGHLGICAHDLRYDWWSQERCWVVAVAEGAGGGGIVITFCPHCGGRLKEPASARRTGLAKGPSKA